MFDKLPAQKKNYLNHKKIASFRKGLKPTESGGRKSSSGCTLHAFEHENGITFSCRHRGEDWSGKTEFQDHFKYKLQLRTLKSREKRFIFYNLLGRPTGVRTASPNYMRSKLRTMCEAQEGARKKPRTEGFARGLYKAQEQRLLVFLRVFLRRQGISLKGLSGDPFSLMVQLCYPGTRSFDDETLQKISTGEFVLQDPVKVVLRTKGKKSRRLLYSTIKRHPAGAQAILKVARYLRINRSLDEAQQFLEKVITERVHAELNQSLINDSDYYQWSVKKLSAKQMTVFNALGLEAMVGAICGPDAERYLNDTFRMIDQLNANEGFDISRIGYRTVPELHDALAVLQPRRGKKGSGNFEHYQFDQGQAPMQFCKTLRDGFRDSEHSICYPVGTEELQVFAQIMHNCAFYYHQQIQKKEYAIFCLKRERVEYMFGVYLRNGRDGAVLATLDQAVGSCNRRIDPDLKRRLNTCIEEAVKPGFTYWHDNAFQTQP